MDRVKAVVDNSIMISIYDVLPNDILHIRGDESDPIIERVEQKDNKVKLYYKFREGFDIQESIWMDPNLPRSSGCIFVHDLKNERDEFRARIYEET